MTVAEIKEYIDERIANIKLNEFITNAKGETFGVRMKLYNAEEVKEELKKILSMLDELKENNK